MQVLFESRSADATALRELAVQRLHFVTRRLGPQVPRARLRLSDVNGPRGGRDKRCQIELATDGRGTLVASAVADDWRSALDSALARAAHALSRRLERSRQAPRRSAAKPDAAHPQPQAPDA